MIERKIRKKAREVVLDILLMTLGSLIYAVSVNCFSAPNNIAPGGVTGVATMLNYVFGTPIGAVVFLINIPIILWAGLEIGYKLVAKSMAAITLNALAIDLVGIVAVPYHGDPVIYTLLGGVCEGLGLSLVFMRGATTGGTDMIARVLNARLRFLSMGKLMLFADGCVILASAFVFQSLESAVYACVFVFVSTKIIDAVLYGVDVGSGKLFFIVSERSEEIGQRILDEMERGVTFLRSRGGYLKREGEMLLCAVRRFEVARISAIVRETDPEAFVMVGDAGEITGEGFRSARSDDRTISELLRSVKKRMKKEKADGE